MGANKACVRCGHVLTEKRTIGGRRYSGKALYIIYIRMQKVLDFSMTVLNADAEQNMTIELEE